MVHVHRHTLWWPSALAALPVTHEIAGSNPVQSAKIRDLVR